MNQAILLPLSLCLPAVVAVAQWSAPVPVKSINTAGGEVDPSPSMTGLTLYFVSNTAAGNYELFRATRTSRYGTFGAPAQITELADPALDGGPFARVDELEIFFYSTRPGGGGGGLDLWRADRASTTAPFNVPVPVTELNSSTGDYGPSLTLDGLRIYFNSDRPGGAGNSDIWTATRPNWGSPFGAPTPVVELNTSSSDRDPHISPDGLVMFFNSARPGGLGGEDIWMASRLDQNSPFGNIVNVAALNTSATDFIPGFSFFHDELFFSSNRLGALGYDIYSTRFTGVVALGIASATSAQELRFSDPASAGLVYVAASSRGSSPGIPIDTRVLPLNFDLLFQLTLGGLPPVLTGYLGVLDQDGIGSGRISFAGFPQFPGFRFSTAFVVIDANAPSGIRTISNAHETLVQ